MRHSIYDPSARGHGRPPRIIPCPYCGRRPRIARHQSKARAPVFLADHLGAPPECATLFWFDSGGMAHWRCRPSQAIADWNLWALCAPSDDGGWDDE